MRAELEHRLAAAIPLLLLVLALVSCRKRRPTPTPAPANEPPRTAATDRSRRVPHRIVPLVVTNSAVADQDAPEAEATNSPPTITCGPVQTFPCGSVDGLQATVAVHVEDADGDPLSVVWNIDGRDRYTQQVAAGGPPTSSTLTFAYLYTPGDHAVKVTAADGQATAECDTSVIVQRDSQDPVITCPGDITVMTDPGQCTAVVVFTVKAADNCPGVTVESVPPSGTAFPIGVTTVTSTAKDLAGNTASCSFDVVVRFTNRCPRNEAYWRQNPGAWPVNSLVLGNEVYTKSQLLGLLHAVTPQDASVVLARQLISASLNTALGSDPRPICGPLNGAQALLSRFRGKLPFQVSIAMPEARPMLNAATVLSGYNAGMLTPNCVP